MHECVGMNKLHCKYHTHVLLLLFLCCFKGLNDFTCICIQKISVQHIVKYFNLKVTTYKRLIEFL